MIAVPVTKTSIYTSRKVCFSLTYCKGIITFWNKNLTANLSMDWRGGIASAPFPSTFSRTAGWKSVMGITRVCDEKTRVIQPRRDGIPKKHPILSPVIERLSKPQRLIRAYDGVKLLVAQRSYPLRFKHLTPTASAAVGLHSAPIQSSPNYTDTLQELPPVLFFTGFLRMY